MPRLTTIAVALVVAAVLLAGTVAAAGGFAAQTQTAGQGPQAGDGTPVRAGGPGYGDGPGYGPGPFAAPGDGTQYSADHLQERFDLTDEQAAELDALVTEMRADGATADEIRAAVQDTLADWGIDHPVRDCDGDGTQARHDAAHYGGLGPRGTMG